MAGHDVALEPDAVRAAIGVTGQFSAVDNLLSGAPLISWPRWDTRLSKVSPVVMMPRTLTARPGPPGHAHAMTADRTRGRSQPSGRSSSGGQAGSGR